MPPMSLEDINLTNPQLGSAAEHMCIGHLIRRGFEVLYPCVAHTEYDMIALTPAGNYRKVQVKSVKYKQGGKKSYKVNIIRGGRIRYTNIDVVVIYVEPEDAWYIIPFADIGQSKIVIISKQSSYKSYEGRWDLIGP